jgi:multidrug efflux pump subunit AcrA (membrane-fusion protein)
MQDPPDDARPNPFLDTTLPHWVGRGLAYLLVVLFACALIAAVAIRVPEVVSGPFTLVPIHGTDPVRASHNGRVVEVRAAEGSVVQRDAPIFVMQSEPVADRAAELETLRAQLRGARQSGANAALQHDRQRRADREEQGRLEARLENLTRIVELKRQQLATLRPLADSLASGAAKGVVSQTEAVSSRLEGDRIAVDVESLAGEAAETRAQLAKLRQESAGRGVQYREHQRNLDETMEKARIRTSALERERAYNSNGGELVVPAPCDGSVLRLHVTTPGAVVQEGDVLGEVACSGDRLQAELVVPEPGVGLLHAGQGVKLLYDAFPYQRFGVRVGTVRWVGPSGISGDSGATFRALIDLRDTTVRVRGEDRPLMPGMSGRASVVVGRRTLIGYAVEPIRQLRESVSELPKP